MDWIEQQDYIKRSPSKNTIKQDVSCFIRTYCLSRSTLSTIIEDTFDSPLVELDLIHEVAGEQRFQFNLGPKPSLTESMIIYSISDFWDRLATDPKKNTLSFSEIMYAKFSPGQVFKLDENSMVMYLEKLNSITAGDFTYDDTAGLKQISRRRDSKYI